MLYFGALISVLFYVFAAVAVLGVLLVIAQRNPIYSVLLLIVSFFGLAGLYVLLEAPFVAVVQIIIYAGAIMVLFLFVVMLLNVPREDAAEWDRTHPLYRPWPVRIGALLAAAADRRSWPGRFSRTAGLGRAVGAERPRRHLGARAGPHAVHRLHVRVRGDVDPDPRRHGRRGRPGAEARRNDA